MSNNPEESNAKHNDMFDASHHSPRFTDPPGVRDIYGRLDRFESHIDKATDKIDDLAKRVAGLEKEVAGGPSFPMWAKGVVATIVLQTFGAVWWASQVDARVDAMPQLSERLTSAFQAMRNSDAIVAAVQSEHVRMRQELDGIHKRTIEGTDDRWRKRDDEARMAELHRYLDAELARIHGRLEKQEKRSDERDKWWQAIWSTGILKNKTTPNQ
jgi:hypothetical protein